MESLASHVVWRQTYKNALHTANNYNNKISYGIAESWTYISSDLAWAKNRERRSVFYAYLKQKIDMLLLPAYKLPVAENQLTMRLQFYAQ